MTETAKKLTVVEAAEEEVAPTRPTPYHPQPVQTAINNLVKQRDKEIKGRDEHTLALKGIDAALLALGWLEE